MAKRKNGTYPLYDRMPPIASISGMLELKAKTVPDSVAFRFRKGRDQIEEKTYSDVYREVKKAASWIERNIGKNQHVAVIGENSYEWLIAFFAVLGSGNVAAAIDKELPANEVAWMIGKADVTDSLPVCFERLQNSEHNRAYKRKPCQNRGAPRLAGLLVKNSGDDELRIFNGRVLAAALHAHS